MQNVTGTVSFLVVATVHQYNEVQQTEDFPCAKNPNNYKRRSRLVQAVTLAAGV